MTPDQRKTLHKNALALNTPAAAEVIELLSKTDFLPVVPAVAKPRAVRKKTPAKHGRQS